MAVSGKGFVPEALDQFWDRQRALSDACVRGGRALLLPQGKGDERTVAGEARLALGQGIGRFPEGTLSAAFEPQHDGHFPDRLRMPGHDGKDARGRRPTTGAAVVAMGEKRYTMRMGATKTGLSIASFVLGLLALACFPFGPVAAVLGFLALKRIRKDPQIHGGRGLARAGIILGVVLGLINLLAAAMVIPGNLNAPSRVPQKRTMSDMRTIGVAWESYGVDHSTFCPEGREITAFQWGNLSAADLKSMLEPVYIKELPLNDGWGRPFQFGAACPKEGEPVYWIRSAGKDGKWDGDGYAPGTATGRYAADIVLSNGQFVQFPEGPQQ